MSAEIQRADVKKALGSVHKMNTGDNVAVLDGRRGYLQNKDTGQRTRIEYEGGQRVMYARAPSSEKEASQEQGKILKGNRFAIPAADSEETGFARQEGN